MKEDLVKGGFFGVCVGDALGLPVQFEKRTERLDKPVFEMIGYGVFNMPPGTWSDDSSLTFCLAESLCNGYDLRDIADRFVMWLEEGYWTPFDKAFDIGGTTRFGVGALAKGVSPKESGLKGEYSNGNGSLMRILPLAFYLRGKKNIGKIIHEVSAITHAHKRCLIACHSYVIMTINLIEGMNKEQAYEKMKQTILSYYKDEPELVHFKRILYGEISRLSIKTLSINRYI